MRRGSALMVAATAAILWDAPADAGCSSVGCARIDWTQVSEGEDGMPIAIDLHGVFVTQAPVLSWSGLPMPGHMVARCTDPTDVECRLSLDALFEAAAARVPLKYEADAAHDFGARGDDEYPRFVAFEGATPEPVEGGSQWPVPAPQHANNAFCGFVLRAPLNGSPCPGDCNGNGRVTIEELVRGVHAAVGQPAKGCPGLDASGDGVTAVNEVVAAVGRALDGCPLLD